MSVRDVHDGIGDAGGPPDRRICAVRGHDGRPEDFPRRVTSLPKGQELIFYCG